MLARLGPKAKIPSTSAGRQRRVIDRAMGHTRQTAMKVHCQITGQDVPVSEAVPVDLIRDSLVPILKEQCPQLDPNGYVSMSELNKARFKLAEELTAKETDELVRLRQEVQEALVRQETLTKNIEREFEAKATRGEKIADKVAAFGGSWKFIIIFGTIIFVWMAINSIQLLIKPFDPFPFIFLNLVLSCVASIQAPVIMMSQNRQQAKDQLRSENDYKTNLKAELEIQA